MGFVIPISSAYLSDGWNRLDFCVVTTDHCTSTSPSRPASLPTLQCLPSIHPALSHSPPSLAPSYRPSPSRQVAVSVVSVFASTSSALTAVKSLRALRALRPLRVIAYNPGMKLVVNSLLRALPGVIHVLLVQLLFLLIFGILGVQLFMGRFAECTDPSVLTRVNCSGRYTHLLPNGTLGSAVRRWSNPDFGHFDDVFSSVLILFEMSMLERWPEVMYRGMDTFAVDEAPRRDASRWAAAYFVLWIFVGALFISNLFVGVVVDNFIQIKEQEHGLALLTDPQKEWVSTVLRSAKAKPRKTFK